MIVLQNSKFEVYFVVKFNGKANSMLIYSNVWANVIFKTATVQVEHQGVNE